MKLLLIYGGFVVLVLFLASCNSSPTSPTGTTAAPSTTPATLAAFDHKAFDELLATCVEKDGWVDYEGLKTQRAKLDQYLTTLASANPAGFPNDAERLAFWINAYNAFTLADVLDDVLGKVKSVRDVKGFFDQKKHKIAGEELTLDQMEKKGRDLKDPRIHFAVNCASASCPKLQPRVYASNNLEVQLNNAAREFLADAGRGMNYVAAQNVVYLSPIFKWYAADFTAGNSVVARLKAEASGAELLEVAKQYMPAEVAQFLTEKKPKVEYLEYDWSLNDKRREPPTGTNEQGTGNREQ